jgi:hypothetical protein
VFGSVWHSFCLAAIAFAEFRRFLQARHEIVTIVSLYARISQILDQLFCYACASAGADAEFTFFVDGKFPHGFKFSLCASEEVFY